MLSLCEKPITGEQLEKIEKENQAYAYPMTSFNFLNDHKGLRPGAIHILLGETGKGKSTLCRSIAEDYAKSGERIIYYSAEESVESFSLGFKAKDGIEENVFFISEKKLQKDFSNFGIQVVLDVLRAQLAEKKSTILFYDNPTAGRLSSTLTSQEALYNGIREIADSNISVFMPVHTSSQKQRNYLTDPSDVRGSKHVSNIADYFYGFYNFGFTFEGEEKIYSGINVLKSRFHNSSGSFYTLTYDSQSRKYTHDVRSKFNNFLEVWKKRHKLI